MKEKPTRNDNCAPSSVNAQFYNLLTQQWESLETTYYGNNERATKIDGGRGWQWEAKATGERAFTNELKIDIIWTTTCPVGDPQLYLITMYGLPGTYPPTGSPTKGINFIYAELQQKEFFFYKIFLVIQFANPLDLICVVNKINIQKRFGN